MAKKVLMPQLGLTMEEGEISAWKVQEGDQVAVGDILAEISTDKLTNDLVSEFEGKVLKIVAKEGEDIPVKGLLAWIGEEGESLPSDKEEDRAGQAEPDKESHAGHVGQEGPAEKVKVLVIGAGPGGYVAAIRAAQLGAEVTIVEKENIGGTCLNVGCIPTKALLHSGQLYQSILKDSKQNGIDVDGVSFDWNRVVAKKDEVVKQLVGGVKSLLKKNKIKTVLGEGSLAKDKIVSVKKADGSIENLAYDKLILATGSVPSIPPIPGVKDNEDCIDSTAALSLTDLPKKVVIIGGGVIGIEFATVFSNFGSEVIVLEAMPKILPLMDEEMSKKLRAFMEKDGVVIQTEAKVLEVRKKESVNEVIAEIRGKQISFEADKVLVAVGRRTATDMLKMDDYMMANDRGRITVNEYLETNLPDVYAIGDCVGKIMLAHIASDMGEIAAENAMGARRVFSDKTNPSCVYTNVEFAGVGFSEAQLKERGIDYQLGIFPLVGNGKALIDNGGKGEIRILTSKEYKEVLGVHILGPRATDLIAEAALMLGLEATAEDVIHTIHAHPTLSEAVREAMLATEGRAIHY